MKYLAIIPMTLAFCLLMFLFSVILPNQVKSTNFGKRIWPIISRFWNCSFVTIGVALLVSQIIHIIALRLDYPEVASGALKFLLLPALFCVVSFLLLLALALALKTLQLFQVIR